MKNLSYRLIFLCSFFLSSTLIAQSHDDIPRTPFHQITDVPKNASNSTALLLSAQSQSSRSQKLSDRTYQNTIEGIQYVSAMIKFSEKLDKVFLESNGVLIQSMIGNIMTCKVPLSALEQVLEIKGIEYLEVSNMGHVKIDKALIDSKIDQVHQGVQMAQGYTGEGVVIGIIDTGFDYTHPTFFSEDGSEYRIKRVWEQQATDGVPPAGFNYGKEILTQSLIYNARTDLNTDNHGVQVAGIAAGSGGGVESKYRGVAYNADLVLVSTTLVQTDIIDGVKYIFDHAELVGKPAVVNISIGSHNGPHDGTSMMDQALDALSGPGRIIVGAAGNEGDIQFPLHFSNRFQNYQSTVYTYMINNNEINGGEFRFNFWGDTNTNFEISLGIFNPYTGVVEVQSEWVSTETPSISGGQLVDAEGDVTEVQLAIERSNLNGKPTMMVYADNRQQFENDGLNSNNYLNNDFLIIGLRGQNTTVHGWAANNYGEGSFTSLVGINGPPLINGWQVIDGDNLYTVGEIGGTAKSIIAVGNHNNKQSFLSLNGILQTTGFEVGRINNTSSAGPTTDQRVKPDVTAPAGGIVSAFNSYYQYLNEVSPLLVDEINNNGQSSYFGIGTGTSFSAPIVSGVVALMLEADPGLAASAVRGILTATATSDNFTGSVPNHDYGYGKLNAFDAMLKLQELTHVEETSINSGLSLYPNPSTGDMWISGLNSNATVNIKVCDSIGDEVYSSTLDSANIHHLSLNFLGVGSYIMRLSTDQFSAYKKFIICN